MNLYQYKKAQVQDQVHNLLEKFQQQDASWIDQAQAAAQMKFRDRAGRYWFVDIYQDEWFFHENGKWLLSSEVPDVMEGEAGLFQRDGELAEKTEEDQTLESSGAGLSPVKVLEDSLRKIRVDYQDGRLSSGAALQISRRHVLIDLQGGIWTVGLQSGEWYRWEDSGWVKVGDPPSPESLLKMKREEKCASCGKDLKGNALCPHCGHENLPDLPDLPEEAYGRLLDYFLNDIGLPENITWGWSPPPGYPDSVRGNFIRQGTERNFCPHCGGKLS
jgi:DNA-directed RNA polymerase subunit RPC12/RpoP